LYRCTLAYNTLLKRFPFMEVTSVEFLGGGLYS
jgi:hypothetical protein